MGQSWYVKRDNKIVGPFTSAKMRELVANGKVTPKTRVRLGKNGKWGTASTVKGLFPEPKSERHQAARETVTEIKNRRFRPFFVVAGLASFIVMGIVAIGMMPTIIMARESSQRSVCSSHLEQISAALSQYHDKNGKLPPAYTVDDQGRRLHSWRTLILPQLGEHHLYAQIDLTKPWDDPVNQAAAESVVEVYSCPSNDIPETYTTYMAVVDPRAVMTGSTPSRFREVLDGRANTILLAEADSGSAVHWMSPQDIDIETLLDKGLRRDSGGHQGGSHELMCDGTVIFITDSIDRQLHEGLLTRAGKEWISELLNE